MKTPRRSPETAITDEQFRDVIRRVGTGAAVRRALKEIRCGHELFARYLALNADKRARFEYAQRWGAKRKRYSKLAIEEALIEMASSGISLRAALANHGFPKRHQYLRILRWTKTDPDIRGAYLSAKAAQQLLMVERVKTRFWNQEDAAHTQQGRRTIHRAWYAVDRLRPDRHRKRDAAARREALASMDHVKGLLQSARRRAKLKGKQ